MLFVYCKVLRHSDTRRQAAYRRLTRALLQHTHRVRVTWGYSEGERLTVQVPPVVASWSRAVALFTQRVHVPV